MARKPIPPANEDPSIIAAREAEVAYTQALGAIRSDHMLSDLARAEKIDAAWHLLQTYRAELSEKFYAVRRARLQVLEAELPVGPNIPADTSRADAVVLHQAFSAALAAARDADLDELDRIWAEAERFNDDTARRGVLTATIDRGLDRFVSRWSAGDPERQAGLREMTRLRGVFYGHSTDKAFADQAFGKMGLPRQPQESRDLPDLKHRAEAMQARRAAGYTS